MNVFHFASSQRYRSRLPLRQLTFTVAVYRAIVVEEDKAELLVEATVAWDGKVLSPAETLSIYKDVTHLSRREAAGTAPYSDKSGGQRGASAPGSLLPNISSLPALSDVIARISRLPFFFFTRPSLEDFINQAEEDVPVDPSPGPSLLAPIVLRQHRRDHQPNRCMFLMWAAGELLVRGRPPGTASPGPVGGADGVADGDGADGGSHAAASLRAHPTTSATLSPLSAAGAAAEAESSINIDDVTWSGTERVLCTLTAEQDEYFFTAKPSLNKLHTLFVDAAYIYTFRVTVSRAGAPVGQREPWAGGGTRQGIPADGCLLPSSIAPLEVLLANASDLAQSVAEQYESLEVGKVAVARRLLRQVAMMAPLERAGTDGGAAAAAAASVPSSSEVARRRRGQGALGPGMPFSAAADRTGVRGTMGTLTSSSRSQRAASFGAALLSPAGFKRSASSLPRDSCQYHVFGTVDRCVGIAEWTLFVRCQLVEDEAVTPSMHDPLPTSSSSSSDVYEFISQLAHASMFVEGEFLLDVDHVFNLPFDRSFVGPALPSSPLRLIATAFTEGAATEGLQAPVAYACVSLPIASPGHHTVTAPMWAPHKTGVEFLRSTLVGGAPGLVDARQAGPALAHRTGLNVKEGLYADSVGTLHITVNIIHHKHWDSH
ncbi:Meckel syndrome type 1 protein [Leishmania donovani]|uniref:Meckel_syndrome_type_1_protein_putative/GeneDB:Lm jF.23.1710 n=1 Tax=Leishmania donovani TaxID=5661 RepID=A0A6J8FFE9_LEIDO|nr:Meckel syndrome type 1 protein [Leishmania donovani]VDZ44923.1 Meckel_syndrome_type_1_protein_putative/GeneDB:LmjF.23.1710 [Leishmania donovani]